MITLNSIFGQHTKLHYIFLMYFNISPQPIYLELKLLKHIYSYYFELRESSRTTNIIVLNSSASLLVIPDYILIFF